MRVQEMTAIEQAVTAIWTEFLEVDDIGRDDDFFDLGGTSLALIGVVMRMSERFALPLDTSIVLDGATVASLAKAVHRQIGENQSAGTAPALNLMSEPAAIPGG